MKRLIAFGDSFTYGYGLKGSKGLDVGKKVLSGQPVPLVEGTYVKLLADKFHRKLVNKAMPGASNKLIWYQISRFEFEPEDIAIVSWTFLPRSAVLHSPTEAEFVFHANNTDWFELFFTEFDANLKANLFMDHTFCLLNRNNVPIINMVQDGNYQHLPWNRAELNEDSFLTVQKQFPSIRDHHPTLEAHKALAELLSKPLQKLTSIKNETKI